jgi:hypothetical protein
MAIFRKSRRRPVAAADATPAPIAPQRRLPDLSVRLREIVDGASAPEESLEPALGAIIETTGARAGALCLFDPRHNVLRLAAETGLSDEGCRTLRQVRRGDPTSWDMPLHGLMNRRAYLIESASRNRYVPRLVERDASVRTVACVPIYDGIAPVGSIVLVATAPRSFGERDVRSLERPLRELGRLIAIARGQTMSPAPTPRVEHPHLSAERDRLLDEIATGLAERARLTAELAARGSETDRLRATLDAAVGERLRLVAEVDRLRRDAERAEALTTSLAAEERERARLAALLEAAVARQAEQARSLAALEEARAAAERAADGVRAEVASAQRAADEGRASAEARLVEERTRAERLAARIQELDAEVAAARTRQKETERTHERLDAELRTAAAREQSLREQLAVAVKQAEGAAKADVRRALEATRKAEEARATALADAETVRGALAEARAAIGALEAGGTTARADRERFARLEAEWAGERERLAAELGEARGTTERLDGELAALRIEVRTLREERGRLTTAERERDSAAAGLEARVETLAAEADRLRETVAALTAERDGLAAERTQAAASQVRLEETLARETAERARLGAALGAAQAALDALQAGQVRLEAETSERVTRIAAELETVVAERDRLRDARSADMDEPSASDGVEVVTVAPAGRQRDRDVAEEDETPVAPSRPLELVGTGPIVVVLDVEPAWERIALDDHRIAVLPPTDDLASQLQEIAPERVVANLAAPGVVDSLIALRGNGYTGRVWGCLANPSVDRALALGMVEIASAPLDPDVVLTSLGAFGGRGTRVVTAGADVDVLMSLRQALTRGGMSVSMAWDGKQAWDLLGVVRPEVTVVDLALPRRDGYGIAAAAHSETSGITVIVRAAEDPAPSFAAVLNDPVQVGRAVPLAQLVATQLKRSESPAPKPAPPKMRVQGGGGHTVVRAAGRG